jgi:hypothetical protein
LQLRGFQVLSRIRRHLPLRNIHEKRI